MFRKGPLSAAGNADLACKNTNVRSSSKFSFVVTIMPKYVIERDLPNAGKLTDNELQGISAKSCEVLQNLGPSIQWQESYVTDDKIYCVYIAPDEELIRTHATQGGFPITNVAAVRKVIDPTTAEARI